MVESTSDATPRPVANAVPRAGRGVMPLLPFARAGESGRVIAADFFRDAGRA